MGEVRSDPSNAVMVCLVLHMHQKRKEFHLSLSLSLSLSLHQVLVYHLQIYGSQYLCIRSPPLVQ